MKRTIKFRAWDIKEKRFIPISLITTATDNATMIGVRATWSQVYHLDYEIELSQFTGLTDKNGKEIYEKDLLRDEWGHIGIVIFREDRLIPGYYIDWNDGDMTGFQDAAHCETEIIGNVFENPELITDQNI